MMPKRPMAVPKISTMRSFTNSDAFCASDSAAPLCPDNITTAGRGGHGKRGASESE